MNEGFKRRLASLETKITELGSPADADRGENVMRRIFPWAFGLEVAPLECGVENASLAELWAHPETWDIPAARQRMEAFAKADPLGRWLLGIVDAARQEAQG